jgi:hypothetical protein
VAKVFFVSVKITFVKVMAIRSMALIACGVLCAVHFDAIFRRGMIEKFRVHTSLSPHVAVLRLFPHITLQTVRLHCILLKVCSNESKH